MVVLIGCLRRVLPLKNLFLGYPTPEEFDDAGLSIVYLGYFLAIGRLSIMLSMLVIMVFKLEPILQKIWEILMASRP